MKRQLAIGVTALISLSTLAACGDDDDSASDVADANAAFCEDLRDYGESLTALAALDPATATKDEYDAVAEDVKSARTDLGESGADLTEAALDNLESQADDLVGVLADAPDDAVVADILAAAQTQVAEVQASAAAVNTAVCTAENSDGTDG
jgi:hypothetical protein